MGAQVAVELRAVALLDDENALLALERGGELFGPGGRQQPRRDQADLDAVLGRARDRFAGRAGKGAPGDHREIAGCPRSSPNGRRR